MQPRPHWSYSQISQYLRCPLQYYFQRILKLPEPWVSSNLVLGSAVHAALAEYHMGVEQRFMVPLHNCSAVHSTTFARLMMIR
jgi:RecB family exonuclease